MVKTPTPLLICIRMQLHRAVTGSISILDVYMHSIHEKSASGRLHLWSWWWARCLVAREAAALPATHLLASPGQL